MSFVPTYPERLVTNTAALGFMGAVWVWLRACLSSVGVMSWEKVGCPHDRPSLLPREAQSAACPHYRLNRQLRRSIRKPIPAVRELHVYRHLNAERLSPAQYLERLCRLSPLGRIRIYRLGMRRRILSWRKAAQSHVQGASLWDFAILLCGAPLSPD